MASALPMIASENGLSRYLTEIRKFPLLEPEQEYMLAKRWVVVMPDPSAAGGPADRDTATARFVDGDARIVNGWRCRRISSSAALTCSSSSAGDVPVPSAFVR